MRQELVNPSDPIGLRLRVARLRAGLKQWELAQRAGVSGTVLSRIETGAREGDPEVMERLWAALETRPEAVA